MYKLNETVYYYTNTNNVYLKMIEEITIFKFGVVSLYISSCFLNVGSTSR